MSLESEITALVSAANKLTSEVANKMKGIDKGLSEGLQTLEEKVSQGFSGEERYCSLAGSDSQGDGTRSNPYRSIAKAINSMYRNGTVYLMAGSHYWTTGIVLNNRNITIRRMPGTNLEDVKLYPSRKENGDSADTAFFRLEASQVNIPDVYLLTEGQATPSEKASYQRCLAFAQDGFCVMKIGSADSSLNFTGKVDVEKNGDVLCRVARAALQVNIYKCNLTSFGSSPSEVSNIEDSDIPYSTGLCTVSGGDSGTMIVSTPGTRLTNVLPVSTQYLGGFEVQDAASPSA